MPARHRLFHCPPQTEAGFFIPLIYANKRSLQHGLHGVYALHAR